MRTADSWLGTRAERFAPLLLGLSAGVAALLFRTPPGAAAAVAGVCLAPLTWFAFCGQRAWLVLFFSALILLPPLPAAAGAPGIHASVLFAGIGLLAGLARAREWRIELTALNGALVAFTGALVASLGFALIYSGWQVAAGSAARVVLFSLAIYVFFSASQGPARQNPAAATRIARTLFWIALAAALFGCVDFVYQLPAPAGRAEQFLWLDSGVYRRAQGLFYEASTLGNFCVFFLVMSAASLFEPREKRIIPAVAARAGVLIFSAAAIVSFSRASVVAGAIACGALACLERRSWASRRVLAGLGILVLAAMVLFAVVLPEFATTYGQRIASVGEIFASPDRILSGRLESWGTLAAFITDHPWQTLLGIGYKTLPQTDYLGKPLIADNMYLSMLVETGVYGLTALLGLNLAILAASWRALRAGSFYGKWMFCFWVGEVVQMLSADILTYWRVLPIYFWVLAQAVTARGNEE